MDCPHLVCRGVFRQKEVSCGDVGAGAHGSPLHHCFLEANPQRSKKCHFVATQAKLLENECTLNRNIMCVNKQSLFHSLAVRINEGLIAKDIRLAGH